MRRENNVKDYLMNDLNIGDRVVYARIIDGSPFFGFGRVNGFTPKKVRVGNITVKPNNTVKIVFNGQLGASSNTEELV